jgi:RNA polymerase sigma factor (sigma-70 family)
MARRFLFRLFAAAVPAGDHVPDDELLRRFVNSRDSAAFELLVRRHANSVWAAGFRILNNESDAEDAFQATFLALVRKAGSIRTQCIGGWLHQVAVNAALKLKAGRPSAATVAEQEQPADADHAQEARPEANELAEVVHQELARLPDRYRLPVVLCDLEGQTHAEAAKTLGWPVGSVSGRLSRAHGILRDRLTRRGFAAPAAVLVAVVAPASAVNAATAIAIGIVPVSPVVYSLTEGVLSAMRIAKLKLTVAVLAATALIGLAGTGAVYALVNAPAGMTATDEPPGGEKGDEKQPKAAALDFTAFPNLDAKDLEDLIKKCPLLFSTEEEVIQPKDDTQRKLLKAMANNARYEMKRVTARVSLGQEEPKAVLEAIDGVVRTVMELDPSKGVLVFEEQVRVMKWYEKIVALSVDLGRDAPYRLARARYARQSAELLLDAAKTDGRGGPARPEGAGKGPDRPSGTPGPVRP